MENPVTIPVNDVSIEGNLVVPENPIGIVIFSHGSGSGRFSPRNNFVAEVLQKAQIATLLADLLTPEEDEVYENRFDIDLLTDRLFSIIAWLKSQTPTKNLNIGLFGASTGAASALRAGAILGPKIRAIVSRGGRPDLAMEELSKVSTPTLLIVGGEDDVVIKLNEEALEKLNTIKKLEIIPGATHLFEEPGTLEEVALLAKEWFKQYLI
jgi:putative phosphoribosyl transferase